MAASREGREVRSTVRAPFSAAIRNALPFDRRIIRNATLAVTVDAVTTDLVESVTKLVEGQQGWIAASQIKQVAEGKNSATRQRKLKGWQRAVRGLLASDEESE